MTTRVQERVDAARATSQFWLWPNLLSLDAPIVAVVWQALFVYSFRTKFDGLAAVLLFLSVWIIYVADRVVDALTQRNSEPRHEFHRRHWRALLPVWIAALGCAAWLAWTRLPWALFVQGIAMLIIVAMYFGFTHLSHRRWPKELAVAILFAAGTSLAAWEHARTWIDFATVVLFAMLCWINCAAIEVWESRGPDKWDEWPVRESAIAVGLIALIFLYNHRPILAGAETASAFAFVLLDRAKTKLSPNALRVLADVALLTPLMFLPIAALRK
jgi:hypothetical protein